MRITVEKLFRSNSAEAQQPLIGSSSAVQPAADLELASVQLHGAELWLLAL
jgi:hypothetical protein